jgi:hypothetical protein
MLTYWYIHGPIMYPWIKNQLASPNAPTLHYIASVTYKCINGATFFVQIVDITNWPTLLTWPNLILLGYHLIPAVGAKGKFFLMGFQAYRNNSRLTKGGTLAYNLSVRTIHPLMIHPGMTRPLTVRPHKLILAPSDSPLQVLGDEPMPDWARLA